ncbi:YkvA family protein [Pseudomonas alkylphenolica]|uniref:YkvA family protein n=1 Tax=Pseudomonas alkylphenolica TaxID=237609 RepID=UPI0018D855C8|nr:YkvA family protein [Pseudomonas alkylphenolica]MBH3426406.1 DUF1232 domain-containing protein [Pseudomonas alkylphenolica]
MKRLIDRLRSWASALKRNIMVLWFCYRNPQTPWLPKWVAIIVVAYALSPIDLIPDFIPVLGYLDDLILLPLGILLALHLMPAQVLEDSRQKARAWEASRAQRPVNRLAAVAVVLVWLAAAGGLAVWLAQDK